MYSLIFHVFLLHRHVKTSENNFDILNYCKHIGTVSWLTLSIATNKRIRTGLDLHKTSNSPHCYSYTLINIINYIILCYINAFLYFKLSWKPIQAKSRLIRRLGNDSLPWITGHFCLQQSFKLFLGNVSSLTYDFSI